MSRYAALIAVVVFAVVGTARIERADYVFRAVALPSGKLRVRFVYRPASFRIGLVTSVVTLGLLAFIWFRHRVTHA